MPEPSSFSRACTASRTSDPVASSVTWRGPQLDSCSTCPISVLSPFGLNPPISCSASVFRAIPFALRSGWTRIQVSIWPPFIEVPTLISRDFFCPLPQFWRGSAHFPLERLDGNGATIHARTPRFLSLFSAGHLSVQVAWSSKINDLQWAGCNWQALRGWELAMRILTDGHKKAASRAAVCFGDVLVPIGTAPALPAELPTRWAGLRRE